MNMMVNASELVVSEAETHKNALKKAISKLVASWEKKQATRAKKVGGFGLLAVSLAACNSSDDTATTTPTTPTTPATPAAPTVNNITVAAATTSVFGTTDNDVITATGTTLTAAHIIADSSTTDADVMNVTTTGDFGNAATVVGVETVNFILESVTALGTTGDAIFEVAATNMAAGTFTMDVNKVGSPIARGTMTDVATGSTVTFSDDFSTSATVTGDDNAVVTVTASADTITADSGGTLTGATMTGTDSAAGADTSFVTDSDAAATFTTTSSDMAIDAQTATTVVATSAGDIDANANDLTAATSVTLTAAHEITVGMAAAASATLSAGGTTDSIVEDGATGTLKTVNLSGNGSAHNFNLTAAEGITTINFTGSQNVTAIMDASEVDALTSNKVTVTDNTADAASANITTTLQLGTAAGDVDATAAAVDAITLAISNAAKTLTVASGAHVVIATDQAGTTTIDGPDAGAASNSVTISMNDGNVAANDTPDVTGGLTLTDFKTAIIDASVESTTVAGATLNDTTFAALNGSADNTNLTIKGGSNTMTLSGTHTVGTGAFIIESDATVALGGSDITASSFTHTGSGAVTWTDANSTEVTTISTGSGNDAITLADISAGMTINTGAGDDTITVGQVTAASKNYVINGGDGADTLSLSVTADLNNGASFSMTGIETVSIADGVTAVAVGSALVNSAGLILTHATAGDNVTITVEMGTANSVDMSNLTIDTLNLGNDVNDSLTISNGAATAALTVTGATGIKNTITTGSGADTITAGGTTTFGDVLSGGAGNDIISGGAGTDTLNGNAGNDIITGGKEVDTISGDAGADTMTGGAGNDIYVFDTGDVSSGESIVEGASDGTDDVVQVDTTTDFSAMAASSFDEIEQIDVNANSITATFTAAQLTGETIGLHSVTGGTATNMIINLTYGETATFANISAENATWVAGEDTITINGVGGNETITGTAVNDTINGNAGDDTITSGGGATSITGGAGDDTITGAGGVDTIIFGTAAANGTDTISSFTSATDKLDLDAIMDGITKAYAEIANDTADITSAANVIAIGGDTTIADAATLIAADTTVTATTGIIVINGTGTSNLQLYSSTNLASNGTETLLAYINGTTDATTLATGDFVFA